MGDSKGQRQQPTPLKQFTFAASVSRLLKPISKGTKRIGLLKVAPRVQGKILETPNGTRFMVVEQKGRDIWRGRFKSIEEAIENGVAGVGVDRFLLQRSLEHDVSTVMVVVEEQRKIFLAPVETLLDPEQTRIRTGYASRAIRVMDYQKWKRIYLGPTLRSNRKRANAL